MTDYTDDWDDLTEKEILVGILTELQHIRMAVTDASDDAEGERGYRCRRCNETVPAGAREQHARSTHKAPPDMIDAMFERAD